MPRRGARLVRLAAAAALLLGSAGCARLLGTYDIAPSGLARHEQLIRTQLAAGQAGIIFAGFGQRYAAPDDDMLRALYQGTLAYYAGDWEHAAHVLDIAAQIADDRITKSISRSALSLVSSDLILPYEPGRTERLMIPYYAALARMNLGDVEGAAVEARRLAMLLQQYQDARGVDPQLAATLRYVTGAIFAAHGDRNDADVAFRNAAALDPSLPAPPRPRGDSGTVIIVLEQGFVAHRVEQGLSVLLLGEEMDLIANGDGDERAGALAFVAARTLQRATAGPLFIDGPWRGTTLYVPPPEDPSIIPRRRPRLVCRPAEQPAAVTAPDTTAGSAAAARPVRNGGSARADEVCTEEHPEIDELPYLLKVAWPVYRADSRTVSGARLLGAGDDTLSFPITADLTRGVVADFDAERALIVARTVARGTAKLALTKGAERKLEEKNEAAGRLLGLIGNIGNVLLERADTRSWHLLPGGVSVLAVPVPAGEHSFTAEVGPGRTVTLEGVRVAPGRVAVVSARAW